MTILKKGTIIVFLAALVVFLAVLIGQSATGDNTRPAISFEQDHLYADVTAGAPDLLQGVSAWDKKDGDLTARVIVESVSDQIGPGTVRVTYAVCDSDGHVTGASRLLTYSGYAAPKFALSGDLVFRTNEKVNVLDKLTANDALEGDISDRIGLSSANLDAGVAGGYTVTAQVRSSLGETASIVLPVFIEETPSAAPVIELSQYLIYLNAGDAFDPSSYLMNVSGGLMPESVQVQSNVDTSVPGVYQADYRITDGSGRTGHTVLNVVVEERGEN